MSDYQPTVGIYTLGCKVNQYESEAIAERFGSEGFLIRSPQDRCDVYVINTCTVTGESDRKARQFIRRAIRSNPDALILVTGCYSQISPKAVASIPGVDYICGTSDKQSVVSVAKELLENGKAVSPLIRDERPDEHGFEPMQIHHFDRTRAYVKIEDGCENHCTYCIIPTARGKVRSKRPEDVVAEVSDLVSNGCHEIVLTGIETASYGVDLKTVRLIDLLERVDGIPDIGRIRLGSLDPSLIKPDFVKRLSGLPSVTPHFHLSLQSGSDAVLARMKRKYNSKMALQAMENMRSALPSVMFTTDIIVGFPQETEEEFSETIDFIRKARFLMIHVFPYSRRKGTEADRMPGQIPEEVKHERVRILSREQTKIRSTILKEQIGKSYEVLFETYENGYAYGHTTNFIEVACLSDVPLKGEILPVAIESVQKDICVGRLLPRKTLN